MMRVPSRGQPEADAVDVTVDAQRDAAGVDAVVTDAELAHRRVLEMRVHVDTDLGGDPDDACALAMLLGWPGIELLGVTTALEHGGSRAGCVARVLETADRSNVPIASGSETTLTGGTYRSTAEDERYWGTPVRPRRGRPGAFLDLLEDSIAQGATVLALGGLTNLAILELIRPGSLADAHVVAMNGWFDHAGPGLPPWGHEYDFNTQVDTRAAEIVAASARLTLVPLPVAMHSTLKGRDLARLRAAGSLGDLLASQSELHRDDHGFDELAQTWPGLPDDLTNFHWDPVAAAIAVGWNGASVEQRLLATRVEAGVLRFVDDPAGRPHHVVTSVDSTSFDEDFLSAVENAGGIGNTSESSTGRKSGTSGRLGGALQ
jgi:inosine-uridine nucleoside N-ribohydrolase